MAVCILVGPELPVQPVDTSPPALDDASVQLHDRHPFPGLGAHNEMKGVALTAIGSLCLESVI